MGECGGSDASHGAVTELGMCATAIELECVQQLTS